MIENAADGGVGDGILIGRGFREVIALGEIVPGAEFYDFDDKYADGVAQTRVPAALDDDTMEAARALALRTFAALRAEGMARVDMFLEADAPEGGGRGLMVNEINTIPGFTSTSGYARMWEATGLAYPDLVQRLVDLALERHREKSG